MLSSIFGIVFDFAKRMKELCRPSIARGYDAIVVWLSGDVERDEFLRWSIGEMHNRLDSRVLFKALRL